MNKTFCFTKRKNILFIALKMLLLSLYKAFFFRCKQEIMILRKRLRVYTIVDFSFIRTFAPSF